MTTPVSPKPTAILNDRNYHYVRQSATIILPAIGALYFTLGQLWGLPRVEEIVGTIAALNIFAGVWASVAKKIYDDTGGKYDGTLILEETDEGTTMHMREVDMVALLDKNEITFKIDKQ